jgi:16S rRNA (guanine527-N7)-methyltransferase
VDTGTIAQLLQPFIHIDETRLSAISKYIDILLKWNARMNLTAIRAPEEIVQRHFGESFFTANYLLSENSVRRVIDVGSGAGFPGVPLAMLAGGAQVTLIESNQKKATFLKEVIFSLGLRNVKVFSGRAEDYPEQADLVTFRAVEKFNRTLPLALELVQPGGRLALMIGTSQAEIVLKNMPHVQWASTVLMPGGHSRIILCGAKNAKVE